MRCKERGQSGTHLPPRCFLAGGLAILAALVTIAFLAAPAGATFGTPRIMEGHVISSRHAARSECSPSPACSTDAQLSATTAFTTAPTGLGANQQLYAGQSLQNGLFTLIMQGDGNLVEYVQEPGGDSFAVWASGTWGDPGAFAVMQGDGNLVVYTGQGQPLWWSGTWENPGSSVTLWDNGNVIIWSAGGMPIWGTGAAESGFPAAPGPGTTSLPADQGLPAGSELQTGSGLQNSSYQDPLRSVHGLIAERIDQGVDYSGTGPVYAIGNARVVYVDTTGRWFPPAPDYIAYTLSDGPAQGRTVYVAECITPSVQVNQVVTANSVIGKMIDCGYGIETGWADASRLPDTMAYACWSQHPGASQNNDATGYGQNFSQLLASLGAPPGVEGTSICPITDSSWPQWSTAPEYTLSMQTDGNLVEYMTKPDGQVVAVWASGTWGHPGAYTIMQRDGNFVVYDLHGDPLWSSGTWGNPGSVLTLWVSGNIIIWSSQGVPIWGSGT